MSEADKMFEELGYKKFTRERGHTYLLKYYKDRDNVFYFYDQDKSVDKTGEYGEFVDNITMQELKAINKKVQELGWIE